MGHSSIRDRVDNLTTGGIVIAVLTVVLLGLAVAGFVIGIIALTKTDDNNGSTSTTAVQYNITTTFYQGDGTTNTTLTSGGDSFNRTVRCLVTDQSITLSATAMDIDNANTSLPDSDYITTSTVINLNCFPLFQIPNGTYIPSNFDLGHIVVYNNDTTYENVRVSLDADIQRLRFQILGSTFDTQVSIPDWSFTILKYLADE
jgi:hypothetical protein